ncbi:MAG: C40 family peptidase [Sulfitobacter sp.]
MSDARTTPDPAHVTGRSPAQVALPVADLCRSPDGPRDRQLVFGDTVVALGTFDGWRYVQADKDGYCGYVRPAALAPMSQPTHKVIAPATHVYERADFKSPDLLSLSFASHLHVKGQTAKFARTAAGYVPLTHLAEVSIHATDPAAIAALFLGTPYLWGGNSRWGIDCSGLVQAALLACAIPCPGDSDLQQQIGTSATGPYKRNDLLFWKGHVALVIDPNTLIHANSHAMSVVYEPISAAIKRIEDQGDGLITAHRRI